MNKQTCAITRRLTRASAANRIQTAFRKTRKTKGPSTLEIQEFRNRVQARRLARFMKNADPNKRRAAFLNGVCSDAGVCMAFGKETAKIRKHFDGFTSFAHLTGKAKRIGAVSANGFVKMLTYSRNGYQAHAILKSTVNFDADNLYYEYLVGRYINKQCIRFPCFVETYGALKYDTELSYIETKTKPESNILFLKNDVIPIDDPPASLEMFTHSCDNPISIAILVEHIKDAVSLYQMTIKSHFVEHDLLYALYQVYMPLATLCESFTHYDLHLDNVLVYEPVKDSYIQYHYHLPGDQVVSFKSAYIAKMIDYGRSYFMDDTNPNIDGASKRIHDRVCGAPICEKCGKYVGYNWLHNKMTKTNYYISSQKRNQSHDLRLLYMLNPREKDRISSSDLSRSRLIQAKNRELYDIIDKVVYQLMYGTDEKPASGLPNNIHNTSDAAKSLEELIRNPATVEKNEDHYARKTKLGDMHVYADGRPSEFHTA